MKKCKCGAEFVQYTTLQNMCIQCAIKKGKKVAQAEQKHKEKEFRAETRRRKDKLKTRSEWIKDAQRAFNRYIRLRDHKESCISCDKETMKAHLVGSGWDCGHYRSVGSAPEVRFEELNAHKQCVKCNQHLSGNAVEYRKRLIKKIGIDALEWLEGPHESKKYTIEDLKEIKQSYNRKARELEKEIEDEG